MADNILGGAVTGAGNNLINASRKDGDNAAVIRIMLNILLILIILGAEGMKIIFRNNFGKHAINLFRMILCAACFAGVAYFAYNENNFGLDIDNSANTSQSFFITSIIYAILAVYILVKGVSCYIKARKNTQFPDYRGDSTVIGFLADYGYSQNIIQYLAEPLYVVIIGVLLWFYNPIGGIPLIFCGLSIWVNALFDLMLGNISIATMKNEMRSTHHEETITNQVISD